MLFITPPHNAEAIRAFCARFNEGLRVEYKSTFDDNVRRNLPKVVSSFANSLGGVLVVGVNALNGVPQQPIDGFRIPNEELALTIENICLQGMNPPVIPRTTVVPSDAPDRTFLVIEVDESVEAPHAIENSKRVYVRTGNAATPYDGADVELIIELIKRREEPSRRYQYLLSTARTRAATVVPDDAIHVVIAVSPTFPRRSLCDRNDVWNFLNDSRYRVGRYFPLQTLRRVSDGVASFDQDQEYAQVNAFGLLFTKRVISLYHTDNQPDVILIGEIFHPLLKLLHCANAFYTRVGYHGNLEMTLSVENVRNQKMHFIEDPFRFYTPANFECFEHSVSVSETSSSELLRQDIVEVVQNHLQQLCWSFWQSTEEFPSNDMRAYVARVIGQMNIRA